MHFMYCASENLMQRDLGMIVAAEHLRALKRDGAIAERGSFGAASDDADVNMFSVLVLRC